MAHDRVGYAPHEGPTHTAQSSASNDYQVNIQLVAEPHDLSLRPSEREVCARYRAPLGLYPLRLLV
jgi:hypothetical protein